MYLKPDADTFAVLPWQRDGQHIARVICDIFTPAGTPFGGDPRSLLRNVVADAERLGLGYQVSPEMEFFLFDTIKPDGSPSTADSGSYFDLSKDVGHDARQQMVLELEAMGIEVEASHHEVATGQHEIDCRIKPGLTAADGIVTLKWVIRDVARRYNLHASFMPKPLVGAFGSGMHLHQILVDSSNGSNLLYDANDPYKLSRLGRHFIAGQMEHARGMCALLAPLVNSYKRLVVGYEAPTFINWARENRSAFIRLPETTQDDPEATRIEIRVPDPSCNPYIALSVILGAGLDGIQKELPLPDALEETVLAVDPARHGKFRVATLPENLKEALDELEKDEILCNILGPYLLQRFLDAKRMEWEDYRVQITPWELKRYLTT
jgi:glutamine synthetase